MRETLGAISLIAWVISILIITLSQGKCELTGRLTYDQVVSAATTCGTHNGFIALEDISSQHNNTSSFIVRCKDGTRFTE